MGQTQGHELPYDVGEKYSCLTSKSIWSVHSGKKKVCVVILLHRVLISPVIVATFCRVAVRT